MAKVFSDLILPYVQEKVCPAALNMTDYRAEKTIYPHLLDVNVSVGYTGSYLSQVRNRNHEAVVLCIFRRIWD